MDSVNITRGAAMFHQLHPKSFIGGFREVTDQAQQPIELVPGVGIGFSHGGIIGQAVFEACKQEIIDALRGMGQLDADVLRQFRRTGSALIDAAVVHWGRATPHLRPLLITMCTDVKSKAVADVDEPFRC